MSSNLTNSVRAVIFDLDGTLIDTASEIAAALNRTLEELGLAALGQEEVEAMIGRGVRTLVERALGQVEGGALIELDPAVHRFEAHYAQTVGTDARLFAGDDGIARKPAPDMLLAACTRMGSAAADSLMLGDSDNDVIAARAAGCPVWCVPYGYNEGRGPETLACDRLVATVDEAARLITAAAAPVGPA